MALARNFKTMLNKNGDNGHSCIVPDFKGNGFSVSPFSMMLTIGLSYIILIYIVSTPSFIRAFIMKGCWLFSKPFSAYKVFFVFASVNMLYYIHDLHMLNHPCVEADLIMVYDLFAMLLNLVCQYFIEDLSIESLKR
jgi:hypothetical protein